MSTASLHRSGIEMICRLDPLTDQYDLIKGSHMAEMLIRPTELREHCRALLKPIITEIDTLSSNWDTQDLSTYKPKQASDPAVAAALKRLAIKGIRWCHNKSSRAHHRKCSPNWPHVKARQGAPPAPGSGPASEPDEESRDKPLEATFKGIPIPTWGTHDLWGSAFDKNQAMAQAVDGGTAPPPVQTMASRTCAISSGKFHHPDCSMIRPAAEEGPHTSTILAYWRSGSPKKRHSKCPGCKTLWPQEDAEVSRRIHATICTDGSTFTGKPSAAAFVHGRRN